MATQYNPTPNMNVDTAGWDVFGGASLSSTSDGGWFRDTTSGSTRYMQILMGEAQAGAAIPLGVRLTLSSVMIRRNTEASETLAALYLYVWDGSGWVAEQLNLADVVFPTGKWVTLADIDHATFTGNLNGEGAAYIQFAASDGGAFDYTVKSFHLYRRLYAPAPAALDSNDSDFTITVSDDSLTIEVDHVDPNEMVDTLNWNFGDGLGDYPGGAATWRHGVNTYPTAGTYTITLEASNQSGDSYTTVKQVTVPSGEYTAAFNYSDNYLDLDVDASPSVGAVIDTYTWDFGDGTVKTGQYASHTYTLPGVYNVELTISNSLGQVDTETIPITIAAQPTQGLFFTTIRNLLEVAFSPSVDDGVSYDWSFGDGNTSTAVSPTHTYATAGTYTVSLTVDSETVARDIVVVAAYTPVGDFADALRLEVEVPPEAGSLYNLAVNPNGEQGGYGWVTPVGSSRIIGTNTATGAYDHGVDQWKLIYIADGTVTDQYFYSEPYEVDAGDYIAAAWLNTYVDGYYRQSIEFLDGAFALVASTAQTGYLSATGGSAKSTPAVIPPGTIYARVRFDHVADTSDTPPAADEVLQVTRVMLSTAATSTELDDIHYAEDTKWLDVLGPTHEIKVSRSALDVGTLNATILDSTLDPSAASTLRPGQGVRLRAKTATDEGTERWESVFWGTANHIEVVYDHDRRDTPKFARISLTASDNITALARTAESRGVELISELPDILEGKGVPFTVDGSSDQVAPADTVAVNENASVLDQVAVTRDTESGYAWVDRNNVLVVNTPGYMAVNVSAVFDESVYSDLDVSFSTQACINDVRIKWLRYTPATGSEEAKTEEVVYGPYTDEDSIREWGRRSAEFTMQGAIEDPVAIAAKADAILLANATPQVRINSVQVPIRYAEDIARPRALIDLYDLVEVSNTDTATLDESRITGIEHEITPHKWVMHVFFDREGSVAPPQVVPSPGVRTSTATTHTRIGIVEMYGGSTAPNGALLCDGSAVSRTTYADLYDVIGTNFGAGDGSTTFNLPDMRHRIVIGAGDGSTILVHGANDGRTDLVDRSDSHSHVHSHAAGGLATDGPGNTTQVASGTARTPASGTHTHNITGSTANETGINETTTTAHSWVAINFIIWTE